MAYCIVSRDRGSSVGAPPPFFGNRHLRGIFVLVIRTKKEYNLMLHPDDGSVESWTEEDSGDKMRADFADFEPRYVTLRDRTTRQ